MFDRNLAKNTKLVIAQESKNDCVILLNKLEMQHGKEFSEKGL